MTYCDHRVKRRHDRHVCQCSFDGSKRRPGLSQLCPLCLDTFLPRPRLHELQLFVGLGVLVNSYLVCEGGLVIGFPADGTAFEEAIGPLEIPRSIGQALFGRIPSRPSLGDLLASESSLQFPQARARRNNLCFRLRPARHHLGAVEICQLLTRPDMVAFSHEDLLEPPCRLETQPGLSGLDRSGGDERSVIPATAGENQPEDTRPGTEQRQDERPTLFWAHGASSKFFASHSASSSPVVCVRCTRAAISRWRASTRAAWAVNKSASAFR